MLSRQFKSSPTSHQALIIIVVAVLYFIFGRLSLILAIPGTNITPIWPASGLALAATFLFGYRPIIGVFFGSFLLNYFFIAYTLFAENFSTFAALAIGFFTGLGAALQAAFGRFLIRTFTHSKNPFTNAIYVFKFLFFALVSSLVNSNIGSLSLCLSGLAPCSQYFTLWLTWWLGDSAGIMVVTPLIIIWILNPLKYWPSLQKIFEAIALFITIEIVALINRHESASFLYLFLPCLIWATLSFHIAGTTLANFLIVMIVIWETANRVGPFARNTLSESLLLLDVFVIIVTTTFVALAAELDNRRGIQTLWKGSPKTVPRWTTRLKNKLKQWFSKGTKG